MSLIKQRKILSILLILAITMNIWLILTGFNYNLLDEHGFRQAQTAISVYYYLKNGIQLDYLTPVFGYPWRVLFEFPTYQIIVAIFTKITHMKLDQSGRLISMVFFYLCFMPLNGILNSIKVESITKKIIYILVLTSPIYIFWSRTFLIESTALFLGLCFIYYSLIFFQNKNFLNWILCTIFFVLGILTKVTTILPCCVVSGLLILYLYRSKINIKSITYYIISIFITFILLLIWTKYADTFKNMNEFGKHITSSALNTWNFGTLTQRLSLEFWHQIISFSTINIGIALFLCIIIFLLFFYNEILLWILFISYCSGFLIFTNLYYVHTYYHYANYIYAIVFMGIIIGKCINRNGKSGYLLLGICLASNLYAYFKGYYVSQSNPHNAVDIIKLSQTIKNNSKPTDIMLICGDDWNSEIPYYSERYAIMDTGWIGETQVTKIIKSTANINIVALRDGITCNAEHEYLETDKFNQIKADNWTVYIRR